MNFHIFFEILVFMGGTPRSTKTIKQLHMFNNKVNDNFCSMNPRGAQDSPGGACLDVVLAKLLDVLKQNYLLYIHFIRFAHILT